MKRIIFLLKTRSKIIKLRSRGYFVKMSFRKDFRIIFLREKIKFKKNYLKMQGAQGEHDRVTRKWVTVLSQCRKG
jgi:hypothetical protein